MTIDPDLCIGSTECNRIAGAAFRLDEDLGVSIVLEGAADVDRELLAAAVRSCPTQAIAMVPADEDTGG